MSLEALGLADCKFAYGMRQSSVQLLPLLRPVLAQPTHAARMRALGGFQLKSDQVFAQALTTSQFASILDLSEFDQAFRLHSVERNEDLDFFISILAKGSDAPQGNPSFKALISAEKIALKAWLSITDGSNRGVYSLKGLIQEVADEARSGDGPLRDPEIVRGHWKTYRGVAHIGAALMIRAGEGLDFESTLLLAEEIRFALSHEKPRRSKVVYCPEREQYSFFLFQGDNIPGFELGEFRSFS